MSEAEEYGTGADEQSAAAEEQQSPRATPLGDEELGDEAEPTSSTGEASAESE